MRVQVEGSLSLGGLGGNCEQSFSATRDVVGRCPDVDAGSVVVLDPGAAANLGCFKWLGRHNSFSERWGVPRAEASPACATFEFGDGPLEGVRCAADIPVGVAGGRGGFAAFALEAVIPACLCEGSSEAAGGAVRLRP